MTKKLGTKRICGKCSAKFYDLEKTPITCPRCETVFDPNATKLKRKNAKSLEKETKKEIKEEDILSEDTAISDMDDVLEDTSDLDDGDDLGVVEVNDEDENA